MKKITLIAAMLIAAFLFSFKMIETSIWSVDPAHSKLGFSVKHLLISDVDGSFKNFSSKITSTNEDLTDAVIELSADINSINTDNEKRDADLKSAGFFDAQKYPKLIFKSTSLKKVEGNNYKLTGDLTMHGITKKIEMDVIVNGPIVHPMSKKMVTGLKVTGKLKRSDFDIGSSTPGAVVGDEVTINANGEFIKE